jgi:hypothetical protein
VDGRPLVKTIFPFGPGMNVAEETAGTDVNASEARVPIRERRRAISQGRYNRSLYRSSRFSY